MGMVLPEVTVPEAPPATVKTAIAGLALSTCSVPLAVPVVPSPAVSVAVSGASPSASAVVFASKA